ncbi:hypothetical protein ACJMK2_033118, partial [Sinanodonta woodiana]
MLTQKWEFGTASVCELQCSHRNRNLGLLQSVSSNAHTEKGIWDCFSLRAPMLTQKWEFGTASVCELQCSHRNGNLGLLQSVSSNAHTEMGIWDCFSL